MTLGAWLDGRTPAVPVAFRPYVRLTDPDRDVPSARARVDALTEEARSALARARRRDPADRDGAFELLAADAWATWAAEAALDTADPVAALTDLARRLSDPLR